MKPKIILENNWSKIYNLPLHIVDDKKRCIGDILYDEVAYEVAGARFIRMNRPNWDAKIHLYKKIRKSNSEGKFLTGLFARVITIIHKHTGIIPDVIDNRIVPEKTLDLKWNDNNFTARDYQLEVISSALAKGRGVLELCTGSGKTLIASKIIQEIGVSPFIFYVLTKDLMYQAKDRLESSIIDLKVGIIGDGKCDIRDVNVMTVQTATTAYNENRGLSSELKKLDWDDDEIELFKTEDLSHVKKRKDDIKKIIEEAKGIFFDECLVAGTRILNKDGIPIYIEEIRNGDSILNNKVTNYFSKKVQETIKITHSINELETSSNHPNLFISKEQIERDDNDQWIINGKVKTIISKRLNIGDFLLVPTKVDHNSNGENKLSFNQLRLISSIMGDGHIDKLGYKIKFNIKKNIEWFEEVLKEGLKDFGINEYKIKKDIKGNIFLYIQNKNLNNILVNNCGIERGNESKKIHINKYIWNNNLDSLKGFIDGFFGCKGDVSKNRVTICSTVSKDMANDIQLLLLKYGIVSSIKRKLIKSKKHNLVYIVSIYGEYIQKLKKDFSFSMKRKQKAINDIKESNIRQKKIIFQNNEYYLSKIYSIEKIKKECDVYDFETKSHNFIANNTLTHNCHHAASKTCQKTIEKSNKAYYLFGGSATPYRADNAEMMIEGLFGRNIGRITASDLIRKGFLIKPDIYYIKLKNPKVRVDNYEDDYKKNIMENEERNNIIASLANRLKEQNYNTLLLIQRIEHGNLLKEKIPGSVFVYGKTPQKQRTQALEDLYNGKIKVLISSVIADEGLDISTLSALIMAGGGKSSNKAKQRVGRVIRISEGKNKALVFDFHDKGQFVGKHAKARFNILKKEEEFNIQSINYVDENIKGTIKRLF